MQVLINCGCWAYKELDKFRESVQLSLETVDRKTHLVDCPLLNHYCYYYLFIYYYYYFIIVIINRLINA